MIFVILSLDFTLFILFTFLASSFLDFRPFFSIFSCIFTCSIPIDLLSSPAAKRQVYVHRSQVAAINCYQSLWEVKNELYPKFGERAGPHIPDVLCDGSGSGKFSESRGHCIQYRSEPGHKKCYG
jgi:hypothetical protein